MTREYEIWHRGFNGYTKWATVESREQAISMADENAKIEPGRHWEVYEVTSERIHDVEIPATTPAGAS